MPKKSNTKEFIEKAQKIHGDYFDYSLSHYTGIRNKLIIICPLHGQYEQVPNSHLRGIGCPKCGLINRSKTRTWSKETFIKKANLVHSNKYDYTKSNYINSMKKITITCPIHGDFKQKVNNHLQGANCPNCVHTHGFSRSHWVNFCNNKKNIDPKVYIIKCYNNTEEFIKIGITVRTISQRFQSKGHLPYEYEVLKEIKGSSLFVFDKEKELHNLYYNFKYKPNLSFLGETECFNISILPLIKAI